MGLLVPMRLGLIGHNLVLRMRQLLWSTLVIKVTLRQLPIYCNISGILSSLNTGNHYLVPPEIDLTSIPLPPSVQQSFHKVDGRLNSFYQELGIEQVDDVKLISFVLPFFHQMLETQRQTILQLILVKWDLLRGDAELSRIIRSSQLFINHDGSYSTADSYFDPRNKVFQAIYKDSLDVFPLQKYQTIEWLNFMGEIGLRMEITVELFIECALRIEALYASKTVLTLQDEVVL